MKTSVIARPNAKKPKIEKDLLDTLPVCKQTPRAVIKALATHFHTKRGNDVLLSGEKAKNKLFEFIVGLVG